MMPSRSIVEYLRETYPAGTRVELIEMNDPYREMPPGLQGTVIGVDDEATIHVQWQNGCTLGAVYGVDRLKKVR